MTWDARWWRWQPPRRQCGDEPVPALTKPGTKGSDCRSTSAVFGRAPGVPCFSGPARVASGHSWPFAAYGLQGRQAHPEYSTAGGTGCSSGTASVGLDDRRNYGKAQTGSAGAA